MSATELHKITVTGSNKAWIPVLLPPGRYTLWLTFPTGVSGTVKVITSRNPNDADYIASGDQAGSQVSFASGGTYNTKAVDITGGKFVGVEGDSVSGGSAVAYIDKASDD